MRRRLRATFDPRSVALNRLEIAAAVAAVVSTWLCIGAALDAADLYRMTRPISGAMQVLGVVGWAVATFAPLGLALCFWRLSKRVARPWLLHLLFVPCAGALMAAGSELMLFVVDDPDFDSTLGGPVMQAALLFVFAVAAYFAAAIEGAWRLRAQAPAGPDASA